VFSFAKNQTKQKQKSLAQRTAFQFDRAPPPRVTTPEAATTLSYHKRWWRMTQDFFRLFWATFHFILLLMEQSQTSCYVTWHQISVLYKEMKKRLKPPHTSTWQNYLVRKCTRNCISSVYINAFHLETTCIGETGHSSTQPPTPSAHIECLLQYHQWQFYVWMSSQNTRQSTCSATQQVMIQMLLTAVLRHYVKSPLHWEQRSRILHRRRLRGFYPTIWGSQLSTWLTPFAL